jgi:hypothetical protein
VKAAHVVNRCYVPEGLPTLETLERIYFSGHELVLPKMVSVSPFSYPLQVMTDTSTCQRQCAPTSCLRIGFPYRAVFNDRKR